MAQDLEEAMRPKITTAKLVSLLALDGRNEAALLALAAGATDGIDAHLAAAICESARERHVQPSADEQPVVVAAAERFHELGIATDRFGDWPKQLRNQGQEVLFIAVNGRTAGLLGIALTATLTAGDR
jgi:P-type Cu+ transporter